MTELNQQKVDKNTDFSRLARFLTGTSIGLVLGGGGAKGSAHVGMIKAMMEANIPIDMIGGTSIGSFMGALWAEENNYHNFYTRAYEWSMVSPLKLPLQWRTVNLGKMNYG